MYPTHLFALSFIFIVAFASSPSVQSQQQQKALHTATLYHLPPALSASPTSLATLHYNPTDPSLSRLSSLTPPKNSTSNPRSVTQIGFYTSSNKDPEHLRTSATATNSFHAPYTGRFRIVVDPSSGALVGASWKAWRDDGKGKNGCVGKGDFDVVTVKNAPGIVFDKPVKGKAGGGAGQSAGQGQIEGEEEVVEKTFLQK